MGTIIEPKILKGTRDFGPQEMAKRLFVLKKMEEVFKLHGYDTIQTPAIEYAETILGKYGDEGDKLTYHFNDHGDRHIALRYDQTVPTARFVAANWSELPMPFKRYQIGPVWRADKPQRGRYREFYQCDIDIIGSTSLVADAEIAKVIEDVMVALEVSPFVIRVNSRKLLTELMMSAGINPDIHTAVVRIIDKLDKLPVAAIKEELLSTGLNQNQVDEMENLIFAESKRNNLRGLPASAAKNEIIELFNLFEMMGIADEHIELDLTLARGLDYYTGAIYEVVIPESGLGSVCGGGRYDNLTSMFSNKAFPGVGVAFGLDRLMVWLEEKGKLNNLSLSSTILVTQFADTLDENVQTVTDLQKAGIAAELYLEESKLDKQLKYANKKSIPWVVIQGAQEIENGTVMLRNMETGEQEPLTLKQVIERIK